MAGVRLRGVNKFYGASQALHDISLDVEDGEFVVFVGPSGCGKSTLLRVLAGLEGISGGHVAIGDRDVTRLAPSERDIAMVFQSYALYPHMTVRENMDFGMKVNNFAPSDRQARIAEAARVLQLEPYLDRKPAQLSGGQRQRVAIGRAIVKKPRSSSSTSRCRTSTPSSASRCGWSSRRCTAARRHHDLRHPRPGRGHDHGRQDRGPERRPASSKWGAPMDLYHRPATEFVAGFIGAPSMNILDMGARAAGSPSPALPSRARRARRRPPGHPARASGAPAGWTGGPRWPVILRETLAGTPTSTSACLPPDGRRPGRRGHGPVLRRAPSASRCPSAGCTSSAPTGRTILSGLPS
jgi:ABC-type uncharacterized transport system YnjBCD ATPase subunit